MVSTPATDAVEAVYQGTPVTNGELTSTQASDLIDSAVSMLNNLFSDSVMLTTEVRDPDQAVKYLAAHKWALALGEVQSESQAGGNVTYNVPPGAPRSLKRTTYGQEFLEYLVDEANIGFFSTT